MKVPVEQFRGNLDDFVIYDNMEDIRQIPGYTEGIDPGEDEISSISAFYKLRDNKRTPCQKLGCSQPHGTGYVIRLKSGRVSNIGNVCGRDFDPENFIAHVKLAKNKIRHLEAFNYIQNLKNDVETYVGLVECIKQEARNFMIARGEFKNSIEQGDKVVGYLKAMANRSDYAVHHTRRLTDEEFEAEKKTKEFPQRQVSEIIGYLANAKCFAFEEHKVYLLAKNALSSLQKIDLQTSTASDFINVSKDVMEIRQWLAQIKEAQSDLDKFKSNPNNINLLPYIV